jgi:biotin transport system substrate-specific component
MRTRSRPSQPQRPPRAKRSKITLTELLWALIGLMLTIGGTLLRASVVGMPWSWAGTIPLHFLGVSYQTGAVMLVACLGGKNAATISQIAYLVLGLGLADLPVFSQGGGFGYIRQPSFGYLLGFVPGAWFCGSLAFKLAPRLEALAFSGLCGLMAIHFSGILYLILGYAFNWIDSQSVSFTTAFLTYSINLLPGQLAVTCAVAVLAFFLRRIMFY